MMRETLADVANMGLHALGIAHGIPAPVARLFGLVGRPILRQMTKPENVRNAVVGTLPAENDR